VVSRFETKRTIIIRTVRRASLFFLAGPAVYVERRRAKVAFRCVAQGREEEDDEEAEEDLEDDTKVVVVLLAIVSVCLRSRVCEVVWNHLLSVRRNSVH